MLASGSSQSLKHWGIFLLVNMTLSASVLMVISSMPKLNTHTWWSNKSGKHRVFFFLLFIIRNRREKPGNNLVIARYLKLNPVRQNCSNQNYYAKTRWFWKIILRNNESLCPWFKNVNNTTFENLVNAPHSNLWT